MCNKHMHSTVTRSSRFHCLIGVINKPTTVELCISPVYRRLAVATFSKSTMYKLLRWPWPRPYREHSLITRLRLRMCTKFEVSSVSRCGDFTPGAKILKRVSWPWPRPFQGSFTSAGWNLQWQVNVPNLKSLGSPVTKLWMAVQNAENEVVWVG